MIVSHQGKTRGNSRLGSQLTTQIWWKHAVFRATSWARERSMMIADALRQIARQ
jgi:hypothetical protein